MVNLCDESRTDYDDDKLRNINVKGQPSSLVRLTMRRKRSIIVVTGCVWYVHPSYLLQRNGSTSCTVGPKCFLKVLFMNIFGPTVQLRNVSKGTFSSVWSHCATVWRPALLQQLASRVWSLYLVRDCSSKGVHTKPAELSQS